MISEHVQVEDEHSLGGRAVVPPVPTATKLVRPSVVGSVSTWAISPKALAAVGLVLAVEWVRFSIEFQRNGFVPTATGLLAFLVPVGLAGMVFRRRWGFTIASLLFALIGASGFGHPNSLLMGPLATLSMVLAVLIQCARCNALRGHPVWERIVGKSQRLPSQTEPVTYLAIAIVAVPVLAISSFAVFVSLTTEVDRPLLDWALMVAALLLGFGVIAQQRYAMLVASVLGIGGAFAFMALSGARDLAPNFVRYGDFGTVLMYFSWLLLPSSFLWASWRLGLDALRKIRLMRDARI